MIIVSKYKSLSYTRDFNLIEIRALSCPFYYADVMNMNAVTTKELFDKNTEVPFLYYYERSSIHLLFINCLRFDDKDNRTQRQKIDPFAPFDVLFDCSIEVL